MTCFQRGTAGNMPPKLRVIHVLAPPRRARSGLVLTPLRGFQLRREAGRLGLTAAVRNPMMSLFLVGTLFAGHASLHGIT